MNFEKIFHEGDRAVLNDGTHEYVTRIDEVTSPETFTVLQPWTRGHSFTTHVGAVYKIVCTTNSGVHYCMVETIGMDISARVRTMHLRYAGKYYRVQNRKAYRCQVTLPVAVRRRPRETQDPENRREEPWIPSKTLDVSATGVKLRLTKRFSTGDVILLRIHIDKFGFSMTLPEVTGMIVRTVDATDGTSDCFCGVEFIDLDPKARDALSKFIMICQRNSAGRE